jgi:hypothetical protein
MGFSSCDGGPAGRVHTGTEQESGSRQVRRDFSALNDAIASRRIERNVRSDAARRGNLDLGCMTTRLRIGEEHEELGRKAARFSVVPGHGMRSTPPWSRWPWTTTGS